MRLRRGYPFLAGLLLVAAVAGAAQGADLDALRAARCAECHGIDGISGSPLWPSLAGMSDAYITAQMKQFRAGIAGTHRSGLSSQMYHIARYLNDDEIAGIARHFSRQPPRRRQQPRHLETTLERGRSLYFQDRADLGCASCHGNTAAGNEALRAPRLAWQHGSYLDRQLKAYRDGSRLDPAQAMNTAAQGLDDAQIEALAAFLESIASPPSN